MSPEDQTEPMILEEILEQSNALLARMKSEGVEFELLEHKPVFTVEEAKEHISDTRIFGTKNFFLRNKKGDRHILLTVTEDTKVDLKRFGKFLETSRLSFASAERLRTHLGILPGSVSPLALSNNEGNSVEAYVSQDVLEREKIECHPLINSRTVVLKPADLLSFLEVIGHIPRQVPCSSFTE